MGEITKKELSQIYWLNREVDMWQRELDRMENQSLAKGQEITGLPSGSRTSDKVGNLAVKKEEIREIINELLERADEERIKILRYIRGLDDSLIRQIIFYRCIALLPWKTVAQEVGGDNTAESVRKAMERFLQKNKSCPDMSADDVL